MLTLCVTKNLVLRTDVRPPRCPPRSDQTVEQVEPPNTQMLHGTALCRPRKTPETTTLMIHVCHMPVPNRSCFGYGHQTFGPRGVFQVAPSGSSPEFIAVDVGRSLKILILCSGSSTWTLWQPTDVFVLRHHRAIYRRGASLRSSEGSGDLVGKRGEVRTSSGGAKNLSGGCRNQWSQAKSPDPPGYCRCCNRCWPSHCAGRCTIYSFNLQRGGS